MSLSVTMPPESGGLHSFSQIGDFLFIGNSSQCAKVANQRRYLFTRAAQ
jgi:hypothetical protein